MQIVVVAPTELEAEFRQKFSDAHEYLFITDYNHIRNSLKQAKVVFDFLLPEEPSRIKLYAERAGLTVFCNTITISLTQLLHQQAASPVCTVLGFNGWPTFINRPYLEVSVWQEEDKPKLAAICQELQTEYLLVDDRVGMVTPRVISMIINEAYYTVQEGTATIADIDLAMKLGTNYPYGPFEWATRIGLGNIYQTLESVYADTKDERYKICPLLKREYLKSGMANK